MARITLVAALLCGIPLAQAQSLPQDNDRGAFMRMKLKASQNALNGIATANFPLIETSASELIMLSKKAEFQLKNTAEYAKHSDEFRRNAEELVKVAKAKNLDAAALAYVSLTLSCVNCHKHLRDMP